MRVIDKLLNNIFKSIDRNTLILYNYYNFSSVLGGFYSVHIVHYPIRIKPDDIWLLIVQAFSKHINLNLERQ